MFRKVLMLLLVWLVFMGGPVYGSETYILEPGKVYVIGLDPDNYADIDVVFSGNVLYGFDFSGGNYDSLLYYDSYGKSIKKRLGLFDYYLYVYNTSNSNVVMTVNDGFIESIDMEESLFEIVMFDGSKSAVEITNISSVNRRIMELRYDESSGSLMVIDSFVLAPNSSGEFEGKGAFIIGPLFEEKLEDVLRINGVYEVSDYIKDDFFPKAPWTLVTDFGTLLEVFWGQLQMLLPVGLIVLSIFLLVSLIPYIVRLFL